MNTTVLDGNKIVERRYPVFDFTVIDKVKIKKDKILTWKNSRVASIYLLKGYKDENDFLNYTPGFMKNFLQQVNNSLTSGNDIEMYDNVRVDEQIKLLKQKTLYIPSYIKNTGINYAL